jgi:hypothetical protein
MEDGRCKACFGCAEILIIECEQVNVPSANITVALLRLPNRSVLLASVYVEGSNSAALDGTMGLLNEAINSAQRAALQRSAPRCRCR